MTGGTLFSFECIYKMDFNAGKLLVIVAARSDL
jgi:hypothetical protein